MRLHPRRQDLGASGAGVGAGGQADDLDGLAALAGNGAAQLGDLDSIGELDPVLDAHELDGAYAPASAGTLRTGWGGHVVPRNRFNRPKRVGWLPPSRTVRTWAAEIWAAVACWKSSKSRAAATPLPLSLVCCWPRTRPCPRRRCSPGSRAPRTVLPSIAITWRPSTTPVRVAAQTPSRRSRRSASSAANNRRNVDSSGRRTRQSSARTDGSTPATHCPVAVNPRTSRRPPPRRARRRGHESRDGRAGPQDAQADQGAEHDGAWPSSHRTEPGMMRTSGRTPAWQTDRRENLHLPRSRSRARPRSSAPITPLRALLN